MRRGSRLSRVPMVGGRDSELYYFIDDGSMDEEPDFSASHRCSMVKRYHIPTFFTPEKLVMQAVERPSPQVSMQDSIMVEQPENSMFPHNGTILEDTFENEESTIYSNRFSKKFNENQNQTDNNNIYVRESIIRDSD